MTFLVRAAVFVLLFGVALSLSYFVDPLGLGLVMFAAFVLVALGWGVLDGRAGPAMPSVVAWFLVALTLGIVMPLGTAVVNGEWAFTTLASDITATLPFILLLVFPPALLGIGVGTASRRGRSD